VLVAFLKIPHRPSPLINHLADMRRYLPPGHRAVIEEVEAMPAIRPLVDRDASNGVLDALAEFREIHLGWTERYIDRWTDDPRGTGGTPYMDWLRQLIDETRAFQSR
jgi:indoleamine 2,3-dioxygenase